MLSREKQEEYKKKLLSEKRRLEEELRETEKPESFGADIDAFDEEADEAEEFANRLAIAQALKDRINEIDSALNKIILGKYGLCEKCGGEISEKVLDVVPESQFCGNCKKSD